jgi:hypothetical protein
MTIARAPPKFRQLPDGLINGSKVFEEILAALPQRDLAVIDISSRAERYMNLSSEYMREFHSRKYRKIEMDNALKDIRKKAYELLDSLRRSGAAIVGAYNAGTLREDPTLGETEHMTEAFVLALDRVSVPDDNKRGPKSNDGVHKIARQAAKDFEDITGKKPNRSANRGGFVDFLYKLLRESGAKDKSPANLARDVLAE